MASGFVEDEATARRGNSLSIQNNRKRRRKKKRARIKRRKREKERKRERRVYDKRTRKQENKNKEREPGEDGKREEKKLLRKRLLLRVKVQGPSSVMEASVDGKQKTGNRGVVVRKPFYEGKGGREGRRKSHVGMDDKWF